MVWPDEIFVPWRLCLFGEHSDWAGGFRRANPALPKGCAILCGTDQGLHARVAPHPERLLMRACAGENAAARKLDLPLDPGRLAEAAAQGGFFSYAAGTAGWVAANFDVAGLVIDNYLTDLPIKKGLSSSAAVCVLVARAFNRVYDLGLSLREEMEIAYRGETATPSRCGRLDQACAFGRRATLMEFDADRLAIRELQVGAPLPLLIVDLMTTKDTRRILRDLQGCYPIATDRVQRDVQHYLGAINAQITAEAVAALEAGDASELGALMNRAQADFDRYVAPASPDELTAPVLHRLLAHPPLQPLVWGGKGVGSQGDGSAQLLARDEASRCAAIRIISGDFGMQCLSLDLKPH